MATYSGAWRGDLTLVEGDDCSQLESVTGYIYVWEGATLNAPALVKTGSVVVREGATLNAPALAAATEIFHEIADAGYVLFASATRYKAGCRGPWDAAKSLAHWNRTDVRAVDFTAAILAHEARKTAEAA